MLRMDGFAFHAATSPEEAVALYTSLADVAYVAGGTDLLPNLKHRIVHPAHLVGVGAALPTGWRVEGGEVLIGAGTRLAALARDIGPLLPPLAEAAALVAGPQIRNMGTIGGNVLLDTRCLYYNQTAFWRGALGHCLKAEGDWCHVIGSPKTCVAAQSSDCVPVLLALDASLDLLGPDGPRRLSLRELYRFDGRDNVALVPGELLTVVRVPLPAAGFRGCYRKLRRRGSIDFPQLGVAVCGTFEGHGATSVATTLDVVVGALNPQPRPVKGLEAFLGLPLTDEVVDAVAEKAWRHCKPSVAVAGDVAWRRHMARVYTRRALVDLRDGTAGA